MLDLRIKLDPFAVESYSPIEHLAKTVWPSRRWSEVVMGMYTACFDASGHEQGQDFVVVSGFLSTADEWIRFESEWKNRLSKDGLDCFHMRQFGNDTKALPISRRNNLLSDLCDIIGAHTFRHFSTVVENKIMS